MKRSFPRLLRPVKGQGKIHGALPPLSMGRQRAGRSRQAPRRTPGGDGGGYDSPLNIPDLASALADLDEAVGGANSSLGTDIASAFSVAFWFYDTNSTNTGLVGKTSTGGWNDGWGFDRWGRNPTFWIGHWSTSTPGSGRVIAGSDASLDTWHHVVGTYDGTDLELWLDGASEGTAAANHTLHIDAAVDAANLTVGHLLGTPSSVAIDELAIWSRVLTIAEIAALSGGAPASNYTSGLVSRWTFDVDGTDSVGSNDLTITT